MKDKEKTQKLIDELKALAENDFERHRIDVLEKDLTEPPTVEVIDDAYQKFNGVVYKVDGTNHYRTQAHLHRDVFSYYFGEIPDGYVIHHKDFDATHNTIDNLQLVTPTEHRSIHNLYEPKHAEVCQICGKQFFTLKKNAKFCSKDCGRKAYLLTNTCPVCGKTFSALSRRNIYCSQKCRDEMKNQRLKEKKENQICTCKHCGKQYLYGESNDNSFCSKYCRDAYFYRAEKNQATRTCVICGKTFSGYKYRITKTCSLECRQKLTWQTRQNKNQENKVEK